MNPFCVQRPHMSLQVWLTRSRSLSCFTHPVLISPFTSSYSTEDRRLPRKQATQTLHPQCTQDPESTYPPTQQKTPEFFHVSEDLNTAQHFTASTTHSSEWKQLWMLAFVLNPPLSPQADLPKPPFRRCQIREACFVASDGAFNLPRHSVLPKWYYF